MSSDSAEENSAVEPVAGSPAAGEAVADKAAALQDGQTACQFDRRHPGDSVQLAGRLPVLQSGRFVGDRARGRWRF